MSDYILTPNMGLNEPIVGVTTGTNYATYINNSLTLIDQHDHTPGKGVQITPSGLNIDGTLTFQGNAITDLSSASFTTLGMSPSTGQTLYVKLGSENVPLPDLWYFDGNNQVQLTSNGATNTGLATLPGESYSAGTFTWKQGSGSTTPANFDIGSITLRPNTAGVTTGVTLTAPATAAFTLTFPTVLPSAQSLVTIDASGNIATPYDVAGGIPGSAIATGSITSTQIAVQGIVASNIANNSLADAQIVAGGITGTSIQASVNLNGTNTTANHQNLIVLGTSGGIGVLPQIVYGVINSAGAGLSGHGFTSVYNGGNNYSVGFSALQRAYAVAPTVVMSGTSGGVFPEVTSISTTGFTFTVNGTITGAYGYSFIVIGG